MSAEVVAEAIDACHLTADERAEMEQNPVPYEHPADTANVSIDDVVVKQQKPHRTSADEPHETEEGEEMRNGRQYVHKTVAHLQHQEQSYCIVGQSVPAVLRIVLGSLLTKMLSACRLQFFVDGQKTLHAAILKAFAWCSNLGMILDWYHLENKCA